MPTSRITVTSTWQQVATSTQEFILDNISSYDVFVTFQTTTPDGNTAYHVLESNEGLVRMGVSGNLWVRVEGTQNATVVLSL